MESDNDDSLEPVELARGSDSTVYYFDPKNDEYFRTDLLGNPVE